MTYHKAIGDTSESIGFARESGANPSSSFFVLRSSLFVLLLLSACSSHARLDNSARLIARPDFPAARAAAPEWCRDALKTVNALELEIERR